MKKSEEIPAFFVFKSNDGKIFGAKGFCGARRNAFVSDFIGFFLLCSRIFVGWKAVFLYFVETFFRSEDAFEFGIE